MPAAESRGNPLYRGAAGPSLLFSSSMVVICTMKGNWLLEVLRHVAISASKDLVHHRFGHGVREDSPISAFSPPQRRILIELDVAIFTCTSTSSVRRTRGIEEVDVSIDTASAPLRDVDQRDGLDRCPSAQLELVRPFCSTLPAHARSRHPANAFNVVSIESEFRTCLLTVSSCELARRVTSADPPPPKPIGNRDRRSRRERVSTTSPSLLARMDALHSGFLGRRADGASLGFK